MALILAQTFGPFQRPLEEPFGQQQLQSTFNHLTLIFLEVEMI